MRRLTVCFIILLMVFCTAGCTATGNKEKAENTLPEEWFKDSANNVVQNLPGEVIWNEVYYGPNDPEPPLEDHTEYNKLSVSWAVKNRLCSDNDELNEKYLALAVTQNNALAKERTAYETEMIRNTVTTQRKTYQLLEKYREKRAAGKTDDEIIKFYNWIPEKYVTDGAINWEIVNTDYVQLYLVIRTAEEIEDRFVGAASYEQCFKDAGAITCAHDGTLYVFIKIKDLRTLDFSGVEDLYFSLAHREDLGIS